MADPACLPPRSLTPTSPRGGTPTQGSPAPRSPTLRSTKASSSLTAAPVISCAAPRTRTTRFHEIGDTSRGRDTGYGIPELRRPHQGARVRPWHHAARADPALRFLALLVSPD